MMPPHRGLQRLTLGKTMQLRASIKGVNSSPASNATTLPTHLRTQVSRETVTSEAAQCKQKRPRGGGGDEGVSNDVSTIFGWPPGRRSTVPAEVMTLRPSADSFPEITRHPSVAGFRRGVIGISKDDTARPTFARHSPKMVMLILPLLSSDSSSPSTRPHWPILQFMPTIALSTQACR